MRLVDRDVKLGRKPTMLPSSSVLPSDQHLATQSCQRHKGHQNGGKAVGGLLTLSS